MPALTLFVKNLPASATNASLEEVFSEVGPLKNCFVVSEKGTETCRGFGYVTFAMEEDANRAVKELKEYEGKRIIVSVAKKKIDNRKRAHKELRNEPAKEPTKEPAKAPAPSMEENSKEKNKGMKKLQLRSKLIIRNLSFKCTKEELKQTFEKFGKVLDVSVPLKADGKMRGFAFVLFKNMLEAGNALDAMNLKEIKGRQVAVDWAVAKDKYVATQPPSVSGAKKQEKVIAAKPEADDDSEEEEVEEVKKPVVPEKKKTSTKPAKRLAEESLSEESDKQDSEEDDEEEEEEEDDDDDEEEQADSISQGTEDDDHSDTGSDNDEDDDDDDDECPQAPRKPLPCDVDKGQTVFIRNLSYDTEEDSLEGALLKYGELKYIRIVLHPDTEHSKGMAFAQFKTKEAAERCIAAAAEESESGGVRVDGRKLVVVSAVSREDAAKFGDKKVKVETGTRNLYLAREGLIRAGTKAAEGVPADDMAKRQRFEEQKRMKLRDVNVFVSKTRLCIHNLPRSVDVKQLRKLCMKAAGGGRDVHITECRVMYDRKPEKGQQLGRSLGYAFVQFRSHEHALKVLRHLNNNPGIHGPGKRPIVEFSLEDGKKLKLREVRQQKVKDQLRKKLGTGGVRPETSGPKKGGPGAKQVQGGGRGPAPEPSPGPGQPVKGKAPLKPQAQPKPQELPQSLGRAQPQSQAKPQAQGRRYAGFQTNAEVEHIELEDGKKRRKVLALPSHTGPKNRMRDKGKQQAPLMKPKRGLSRRERQGARQTALSMEKPSRVKAQKPKIGQNHFKSRDNDRFDSLVEQYKRKLMGGGSKTPNIKKNKWFNS